MNIPAALPGGLEHVRTTPRFTDQSVPPSLRREHQLAAREWGRLVVDSGALRLVFAGQGDSPVTVHAGGTAIIPPERVHHVELEQGTTFSIEIHREREQPAVAAPAQDETLQRLARSVVAAGDAPGVAIAVVGPGERLMSAVAGDAVVGRDAMTIETACNWFSMTKIAIATTAVLLADRDVLVLDEPVAAHLGDIWPDAFGEVTMRHLLSHTAGLRNPLPIRWVHPAGSPAPDQRAFLARLMGRQRRPRYRPGTRAAYSNVGYLAAGVVIADATGRPLDEVVHQELLRPLGMRCTAFGWDRLPDAARATGYHPAPAAMGPVLRRLVPAGIVADRRGGAFPLAPFEVDGLAYGGLVGSARDAARLVALHANRGFVDGRRLVPEQSITAMTTIADLPGKRHFGLGWFRDDGDATGNVQHLGGGMGFFNVMRLDPQGGVGAVIFSNTTRRWDIRQIADAAIAAVAG
jgi:CubicO group peptidase (beta-lactamase class C family)